MSFSDEIYKASSKRHAFIKMSPSRDMSASITNTGSGYLNVPHVDKVSGVKLRESATDRSIDMTLDTGLSTTNTWYSDGTTIFIRVAGTISTLNVFVTYDLHFTDDLDTEDLTSMSTGTPVMWLGRVKKTPVITSSISNAAGGVLTTSSSSFSLENSDYYINQYITTDDWYLDAPITVWFKVNDQPRKMFEGIIRTIDITGTTVVFGVLDKTVGLDKDATFGSTTNIHTPNVSGRSSLPIPHVFTETGSKGEVDGLYNVSTNGTTFNFRGGDRDIQAYTTSGSSSRWTLCRANSTPTTVNFGSVSSASYQSGIDIEVARSFESSRYKRVMQVFSSGHNLKTGDTYYYQNNGSGSLSAEVIEADVSGGFFLALTDEDITYTYQSVNLSLNGPTYSGYVGARVTVKLTSGEITQIKVGHQSNPSSEAYIVSTLLPAVSGQPPTYLIELVFKGGGQFVPTLNDELFFSLELNSPQNDATSIVESSLRDSGFGIDTASINTTRSALGTATEMIAVYPELGSQDHKTNREVLEEVMTSTGGFVSIDNSGVAKFSILGLDTTPTRVRTQDEMLSSTLTPNISYADLREADRVYNPHLGERSSIARVSYTKPASLSNTLKSKNRLSLYGVFNSVVENLFKIVRSKPKILYRYRVDALDLDLEVGDVVKVIGEGVLTTNKETTIQVIKIIKSTKEVAVTGLEIT